jgi:DNA replication and repair protein RecF
VQLGSGVESPAAPRRIARIDGEDAPLARLADHVRPIWLSPIQDRLFQGGAGDRRRFLDRLVLAADPSHGARSAVYERALRERMRLLGAVPADPVWLDALEAQAAAAGAVIAEARANTLRALREEIARRGTSLFPAARLDLTGEWDRLALDGESEIEPRLALALKAGRGRDAAAGRALTGPHRTDLEVQHVERERPAAQCSTGEQKALILNLVLAQAGRLSRAISAPNPILLLDEVAAHLDEARRAALFDEIEALSLQALLTGTDEALFATLKGRALGVSVNDSSLGPMND